MDNQQSTKMPKPFDNDPEVNELILDSQPQQFQLREDDRLKQEDDYRQELLKIQDEIVTLRQVLGAKLKRENELKTLLGVGFVEDLKQDWNDTVHDIKSSNAYQKTAETLQAASDKISPVVQTVNTTFKTRLGLLKNSNYFKTFENTFGSTVNAVKSKMSSSKSTMNFNGNNNPTGASMTTSVTHDEHLNFGDMGSWKLEVIRMACYISFPLAAMFLFSRPEFFKERVIADRKRYHPPPNPERDEIVKQLKERERIRREAEVLEQMSHYQSKQKDSIQLK